MALPDFFVAGAPKAGTTAVHAALARHPSLYMSAVKEPKFFLTDGPPPTRGGPGDVQTYREHVWRRDQYEALFDPAPPGTLRGESTPFYLYNRDAQRRIRALARLAERACADRPRCFFLRDMRWLLFYGQRNRRDRWRRFRHGRSDIPDAFRDQSDAHPSSRAVSRFENHA